MTETSSLAKSVPTPSSELAKLRESLAEFERVVDAYVARRVASQPSSFQPRGDGPVRVVKFVAGMPDGAMLESRIAESAEV